MSIDDLRAFIAERILMEPTRTIEPDDDLLLTNVLDSLRVMMLVRHLEEVEGLAVPPEDFTLENFQSLRAIHDYLERRRASRSPGSA